MKTLIRFLSVLFCVAPFCAADAVVSQTAGNNLTAYNGESGSTNNNRWNTLMNPRNTVTGTAATADFGNCNAVILRCAQPKCANGGCADMSVTAAIVSGCVQSNASCKQYGDDLVQYISAQLVANSTAKANAAANAAQTAAANAAAQQSAQQMQQMQAQMQQMQSQMAAQNAQQMAQLESALAEQKQLTADAIAQANAAREAAAQPAQSNVANGLTDAQITAAQNGVLADVLAREQISGQIMSSIENAETQLKTLKATMNDVFSYAGCDSHGNNCTGPKRVKMFKQKAEGFFDPYENVLDELYDALILAQSVGVDITDIYMMLNGSCNVWGQYLCNLGEGEGGCEEYETVYTKIDDTRTNESKKCVRYKTTLHYYDESNCSDNIKSTKSGYARGGHECRQKAVIPPEDDITCTLNKTIIDNGNDPVQRDWLWGESNVQSGANIRVGCASDALTSSALFRNRKKQAKIDIETLEKIIAQDAPATISKYNKNYAYDEDLERVKYCMVGDKSYPDLQKWVATKGLPSKICMSDTEVLNHAAKEGPLTPQGERMQKRAEAADWYKACNASAVLSDCSTVSTTPADWTKPQGSGENQCCVNVDAIMCLTYAGGQKWENNRCVCKDGDNTYWESTGKCMTIKDYCKSQSTMPLGNNSCYTDCQTYCTTDNNLKEGTNKCRNTNGKLEPLNNNKKCVGTWDPNTDGGQCKCEEK